MPDPGSSSLHGFTPDQHDQIIGLLILRHLYDGDVIDYPMPAGHPHQAIFAVLEKRGWIARWDRTWPLHDRYRLTESGIAEIEGRYKPAEAERVYQEMKNSNVPPTQRNRWLQDRGYNSDTWPTLHDPYTHWSTWDDDPGPYHRYVYASPPVEPARPLSHSPAADPNVTQLDDLDRQAGKVTQFERDLGVPVSDVS